MDDLRRNGNSWRRLRKHKDDICWWVQQLGRAGEGVISVVRGMCRVKQDIFIKREDDTNVGAAKTKTVNNEKCSCGLVHGRIS